MGGAIHHDQTLIDSSDEDTPFVVSARPSRRVVLVPESGDATPQSIQDREWDSGGVETPNTQATTLHGLGDGQRRVHTSRRLVLMSQGVPATEVDESMAQREVHESDTESVMTVPEGGFDDDLAEEDGVGSEGEPQVLSEEEEDDEEVPFRLPGVATLRAAFASLDVVNLTEEFDQRASVLKTVPHFLRGLYRIAMRVLQEIEEGNRGMEPVREERGWKLFLLLPRMMLHRPPRGGLIPRSKLIHRFELFVSGRWTELLVASEACCQQAAISRRRQSRRVEDDITRRLDRADSLVHMGELSSARQALEGASLAPGTEATLNALRDPEKRPRVPREPLPRELVSHVPAFQFNLDADQFPRNVRSARRRAAGGPSGRTVEHLQPLLTVPRDVRTFHHVAERLSRGQVPSSISPLSPPPPDSSSRPILRICHEA